MPVSRKRMKISRYGGGAVAIDRSRHRGRAARAVRESAAGGLAGRAAGCVRPGDCASTTRGGWPGEEAEEGGDPSADRARRRRGAGQPGFQVLQAEVVQRLSEPRVSRRCRKLIAVGTERMRPQPFHVAEVGEEGLEAGCHGGRAGASCPACQRNPA